MTKKEFDRGSEHTGSLGVREEEEQERYIEHCKRNIMRMNPNNPYHFDEDEIPEGVDYLWVTTSLFGVPSLDNEAEMRSKGWTPVPSSRHPGRSAEDFFGKQGHLKGYICRRGALLCERPKELGNLEKKMLRDRALQALRMPALNNMPNDPTIIVKDRSFTGLGLEPSGRRVMSDI